MNRQGHVVGTSSGAHPITVQLIQILNLGDLIAMLHNGAYFTHSTIKIDRKPQQWQKLIAID